MESQDQMWVIKLKTPLQCSKDEHLTWVYSGEFDFTYITYCKETAAYYKLQGCSVFLMPPWQKQSKND